MAVELVAGPASKMRKVVFWVRVAPGLLRRVSARRGRCGRCARRVSLRPSTLVCGRPPLHARAPAWDWLELIVKGHVKRFWACRIRFETSSTRLTRKLPALGRIVAAMEALSFSAPAASASLG